MSTEEQQVLTGFQMGQRVQISNPGKTPQVGTVKYIGSVQGHEGEWIGVDWDNGHGRHNGTVNGIHYFDTSKEQSGSLVRPHMLDCGITLSEAIIRRYNASRSSKEQVDEEMYVMSVRHRRMAVELVGQSQIEARQKQLQYLLVASLAYAGIRSFGPPGEISSLVPNIRELDLTGNLIPDWIAVGHLCTELVSIEVLNLSWNRFGIVSDVRPQEPFNIKTLVLNHCCITWKEVVLLKECLSTIEELHLCGNKIQAIESPSGQGLTSPGLFVTGFESLRLLNLEENCIESWDEIMKFSKLKRLEYLNLTSNSLKEISYPDSRSVLSASEMVNRKEIGDEESNPPKYFESLCCLLLGKNEISDWASVDALNKFPALTDVRLSGNPLAVSGTGAAPRFMLIARIQKITSLNGSEIKPRERKDAEIRYVRHTASSVAGSSMEEVDKLHPRFAELKRIYDVPLESVHVGGAQTAQKMSASLLTIKLLCVSSSVGEKPPITRKVPASTTVGKLKQICEALFKLRAGKQSLYVKDEDPLPVLLDMDSATLEDLGLGADSVILVDDAPN